MGFPFLRSLSQESTAIQMGGVLPYKMEVYCRTFQTSCRGLGFPKHSKHPPELAILKTIGVVSGILRLLLSFSSFWLLTP